MDREKAIQILKRCGAESYCSHYKRHYCCIGCGQREALDLAIEALKEPMLVRCKDCKWWSGSANTSHNNHLCKRALDQNVEYWTRCDDYCSYGEKQVTGKLNNPDDSLLTEDSEAGKEQKSKLESDLISRQAALDALAEEGYRDVEDYRTAVRAIGLLPTVEPPKKVVAQIKVDIDEVVERIKEEYEIKDRPACEDTISRADTIRAMCKECEFRGKCEGDCTEVAVVRGMPPAEPERPKGEWIQNAPEGQDIDPPYICSICGYAEATRTPFCEQCGCRMIGDDGNDNE